jgi:dTDP-4-amino-4,6-dideoxygalactose transaminase
MRQYGWTTRDHADVEGRNSRLDEFQAAILRAKLPALEGGNARRRAIAECYDRALRGLPVTTLTARPGSIPAAHLYPIRTARRDSLRSELQRSGIETAIHYPVPLHLQPAYAFLQGRPGDFPVSESSCETVLSLPLRPSLSDAEADAVAGAVCEALGDG